ncbi:hypothetical protein METBISCDRAFT_21540 [Metschnikowia bicuspidata]|uniref:Uncharacterized protein n=1 Tax=Metschnikowia bicuspidata TaxID=27322 RepID=A0A4P9ZIU2_9ASCO|nr:hypothetical protein METBISCDRAFT_21540 [Metschnikowia bicuspidata]
MGSNTRCVSAGSLSAPKEVAVTDATDSPPVPLFNKRARAKMFVKDVAKFIGLLAFSSVLLFLCIVVYKRYLELQSLSEIYLLFGAIMLASLYCCSLIFTETHFVRIRDAFKLPNALFTPC